MYICIYIYIIVQYTLSFQEGVRVTVPAEERAGDGVFIYIYIYIYIHMRRECLRPVSLQTLEANKRLEMGVGNSLCLSQFPKCRLLK